MELLMIGLGIALWSGSTILSYKIEKKTKEQLFEDISTAGYKVNSHKWSEMKEMLGEKEHQGISLKHIIPVGNLFIAITHRQKQKKNKKTIFRKLQLFGVLEEQGSERIETTPIEEEVFQEGLYHQEDISQIVAIGGRKQTLETLRDELLAHSIVRQEEAIKKVK